jgi:hypothetical protein
MVKWAALFSAVLVLFAERVTNVQPEDRGLTLAAIMTNDPVSNQVNVYDTVSTALLQTLSAHGTGGVGGNARGVKQYKGEVFAAVNNGSNTVAVYRREGNRLRFDRLVTTTSPPVSIDFANGHMYVAGATTVDSFVLRGNRVADCWTTRVGKYVFTANTASKTLSRLAGTGNNIFVDSVVAAAITTGGNPSDADAANGIVGVIDNGAGPSHLSLFTYNRFGELSASGTPINLGVKTANGVALIPPSDRDEP